MIPPTAAILLPAFHEAIPVRKTGQVWIFEDESCTIRNDLSDVWSADRRNDFYATILGSLVEGKTEGEAQGLVWELDPDFYGKPENQPKATHKVTIAVTVVSCCTLDVEAPDALEAHRLVEQSLDKEGWLSPYYQNAFDWDTDWDNADNLRILGD
jgi:hypothetical protein